MKIVILTDVGGMKWSQFRDLLYYEGAGYYQHGYRYSFTHETGTVFFDSIRSARRFWQIARKSTLAATGG